MNTIENTYHNYSIMTDKERNLSCNTKILNEIERLEPERTFQIFLR